MKWEWNPYNYWPMSITVWFEFFLIIVGVVFCMCRWVYEIRKYGRKGRWKW